MTHQIKGVVDSCTQRDQKTRNGMGTIHGCIVDGVEFETGFNKKYSDGEMITTAVKWDYGKWNAMAGTGDGMPIATAGGAAKQAPKPGGFQAKGRGSFPVDPKDGTMSIIRQNSMAHATKIVRDMVDCGVLVGLTTPDDYLKEVVETALAITDFSSGNDITQMLKAVAANKMVANSDQ